MKRLLFAVAAFSMLCTGCDKDGIKDLSKTLAGSIAVSNYDMEYELSYGGVRQDTSSGKAFLFFESDDKITFYCGVPSAVGSPFHFSVSIPSVTLSGEAGDVTFDHSSRDAEVSVEEEKYTSVGATISGRIKKDNGDPYASIGAAPLDCDIDIECIVDGGPLILHITRMGWILDD